MVCRQLHNNMNSNLCEEKQRDSNAGNMDAGEDGGGLACVIYEFCPGQEDQ